MIRSGLAQKKKNAHFNARLPQDVSDRLHQYARRRRISTSAAAVELLDEALRQESFPGIDFRWTALGRLPFVTGTGLSVWELYHLWLDHDQSMKLLLKNYPHLPAALVPAAVSYAKAFLPEEPPGFWGTKPAFARVVRV